MVLQEPTGLQFSREEENEQNQKADEQRGVRGERRKRFRAVYNKYGHQVLLLPRDSKNSG